MRIPGALIVPQGAGRGGDDAVVKIERSWASVLNRSGYEPVAELVPQPGEVSSISGVGGARRFDLDADVPSGTELSDHVDFMVPMFLA